jgi:hypothetical protein
VLQVRHGDGGLEGGEGDASDDGTAGLALGRPGEREQLDVADRSPRKKGVPVAPDAPPDDRPVGGRVAEPARDQRGLRAEPRPDVPRLDLLEPEDVGVELGTRADECRVIDTTVRARAVVDVVRGDANRSVYAGRGVFYPSATSGGGMTSSVGDVRRATTSAMSSSVTVEPTS